LDGAGIAEPKDDGRDDFLLYSYHGSVGEGGLSGIGRDNPTGATAEEYLMR